MSTVDKYAQFISEQNKDNPFRSVPLKEEEEISAKAGAKVAADHVNGDEIDTHHVGSTATHHVYETGGEEETGYVSVNKKSGKAEHSFSTYQTTGPDKRADRTKQLNKHNVPKNMHDMIHKHEEQGI